MKSLTRVGIQMIVLKGSIDNGCSKVIILLPDSVNLQQVTYGTTILIPMLLSETHSRPREVVYTRVMIDHNDR